MWTYKQAAQFVEEANETTENVNAFVEKMRSIESLATRLRSELEELSEFMRSEDGYIFDTDCTEWEWQDVQDMADEVNKIEVIFEYNNEK